MCVLVCVACAVGVESVPAWLVNACGVVLCMYVHCCVLGPGDSRTHTPTHTRKKQRNNARGKTACLRFDWLCCGCDAASAVRESMSTQHPSHPTTPMNKCIDRHACDYCDCLRDSVNAFCFLNAHSKPTQSAFLHSYIPACMHSRSSPTADLIIVKTPNRFLQSTCLTVHSLPEPAHEFAFR